MTVEQLEIIVTAKVEGAVREVMKLVPQIKQTMKQVQEVLSKVDTKSMQNKFQQAVQFIKKKMQHLKENIQNNEIVIKVNNKDAEKQISQIQKQIDSLQEKINARQIKLNVITPKLDEITEKTTKDVTPEGVSPDNPAIQKTINNSLLQNKEYSSLLAQEEKITQEIAMYSQQLENAKSKMSQLEQETNQTATTQSKMSSFFSAFKSKLDQAKSSVANFKNAFNQVPKLTQNITNNIKKMGSGIKKGIGHFWKYASSLFSLRSIYSTLSNSASEWLSSQNTSAKQLSANIDYMKYAMGSAFAPIIQWVINLVYQLMKAIQSVVYALFKVNIFANASAKSYSSMAGSASKAKKETQQLAGIHDELNNIQNNDDSDSGSESDGGVAPNFDLSNVNSQMSSVAQKIYDFFKPLKDSWDMYGQTVIEAFKSAFDGIGLTVSVMWSSVESIFTNGTIFSIIANILNSIGEIGNAWANAWTNDNNGTEIIQGIVNIINDLTNAILNLVSSTGFQSFLNGIISAFTGIVQFLEPVVSGFIEMSGIIIEIVMSTIGDLLTLIGDTLQAIGQNETAVTILRAVGEAIAIIVAGIIAWNVAQLVLNGLMGLFALLTSPITWIVIAITAIIAIIVLCIQHWNEICEVVSNVVNAIVEFIQELWNNVSFIFEAIWEVISTILGFIWNMFMTVFEAIWNIVSPILNAIWQIISTIFQAIWNIISSILGSIWNVFSQVFNWIWELTSKIFQGIWNVISPIITAIWEGIKTALSGIQQVWSTIWNTVSNVVRNVWNGIWSCIKGVINTILGGIEGFVNGVIKGINFLLSGISSIANAVGSLIGLSPINLKINTISLPRLAKGGVLTKATAVIAGEYSGASTNPEIVTPQNIMEETFDKVMSRYQGNNNEKPIYLTVNVSNKKLGHILLDDLRDMKRQTGNGLEALVGG